ncbi:MAG: hypothetical protein CM15mP65_29150 [Crocinitomicaceae bacterium]|nr:MAG: hypothetical protein CM15mP65_29150 [Crocinitomicaceae bacterium]
MDIDMIAKSFSNDCNLSTANMNEIEKKLSIYKNPTVKNYFSVGNFNGFKETLWVFGKLLETPIKLH